MAAHQHVGTVVKLDGAERSDVVNTIGGSAYTMQITDLVRLALVKTLKIGDKVAASVGALTFTSSAKCG